MTPAHTPGPWRVDRKGVCAGNQAGAGVHFRRIANTSGTYAYPNVQLDAENSANARLIAAAPTLLQVLKDVALVDQRSPSTVLTAEMRARMRAAIAKAEAP